MPKCKSCSILDLHPDIVDEYIVFGPGCPAEVYGYDCPDLDLVEDEETGEGDWIDRREMENEGAA